MTPDYEVVEEVGGLYRIIALRMIRQTEGVDFHAVPLGALEHIGAIDRVLHGKGAISPGAVGDVERPWYMHTHQADNLLVLHGERYVEIYTAAHGRVESFVVAPHRIEKNGAAVLSGAGMLVWPVGVFHRIISSAETGSASVNLAVHYAGFDMRTNFNVYDLDTRTGQYRVIREGHRDQPGTS